MNAAQDSTRSSNHQVYLSKIISTLFSVSCLHASLADFLGESIEEVCIFKHVCLFDHWIYVRLINITANMVWWSCFLWDHQAYCGIFENGVRLMYTQVGVSSSAKFITAYEESQ